MGFQLSAAFASHHMAHMIWVKLNWCSITKHQKIEIDNPENQMVIYEQIERKMMIPEKHFFHFIHPIYSK